MTGKPTAHDVKAHLDEARRNASLTMACIWGAVRGTAPADRWDLAADDLRAASEALAKAQAALAAMEKPEPYCTVCGEPLLSLMAGWSHFSDDAPGAVNAGHEPSLDWRRLGEAGERYVPGDEDDIDWNACDETEEDPDAG